MGSERNAKRQTRNAKQAIRHVRLLSTLGLLLTVLVLAAFVLPARGQSNPNSIVNSKHNLSVSGPGTVKAAAETEVCIFCHTPHRPTMQQPLWNRTLSTASYTPYTSTSLKSSPGQPTGSSKLCLSCHDGTIALGSVSSRNQPILMAQGITKMPAGAKGNLGTDLSDDHPISFKYDANLVTLNPALVDPRTLPKQIRLDGNGELQCLTCHDAHNNQYGSFLVTANTNSELCNACHIPSGTDIQDHQSCATCHQMHTAPSGPYLLTGATASDTCLTCHGGTSPALPYHSLVAWSEEFQLAAAADKSGVEAALRKARLRQGTNVLNDLGKLSPHDTRKKVKPGKKRNSDEVVCSDCHEPHSIRKQVRAAGTPPSPVPTISGTYGKIKGVSIDGGNVGKAQAEYQVCLKCHGDTNTVRPVVSRQLVQTNVRLQFSPSAASYHPVAARGKSRNVPSLIPPYTTATLINCSDCHGSETSKKVGGSGANGPHGSNFSPLLLARYDLADFTNESPLAYALCYKCHERTNILADRSFPKHKKHIVDNRTPCSACHTAHGVSSAQGTSMTNAALINFDTLIVLPEPTSKKIEYRQTGIGHGTCTLKCHGKVHVKTAY